ncbi:MAG: hypothetical protein QW761_01005 [Candidatus Aenigmatarchaeota archaeon]
MRGLVVSQIFIIVLISAATFAFIFLLATPYRTNVAQFFLVHTCGNGVCDSELEKTLCPPEQAAIDCPEPTEYNIQYDHLVYERDDFDTLCTPSSPLPCKAENYSEASDYFVSTDYSVDSSGAWQKKEECQACTDCSDCSSYGDFSNAFNATKPDINWCSDCEDCDEETGECTQCWSCKGAIGLDGAFYPNCRECGSCTGCDIITDKEIEANPELLNPELTNNCTKCMDCAYCETPSCVSDSDCTGGMKCNLDTNQCVRTYPQCGYCAWCDVGSTNCHSCGDCNMTLPADYYINTEKYTIANRCWSCKKCDASKCARTAEPDICKRIKDCISGWDGTPCEVDPDIATHGKLDIAKLKEALKHCRAEDIMEEAVEGGRQKLCHFSVTSIDESDYRNDYTNQPNYHWWFNDCGAWQYMGPNGSMWKYDMYEDATIPRLFVNDWSFDSATLPPGYHYKLVVGGVNMSYSTDGNCRFNLFLCGSRTVGTAWDDTVMQIYSDILSISEQGDLKTWTSTKTANNIPNEFWFRVDRSIDLSKKPSGDPGKCTDGKDCDAGHIAYIISQALTDWAMVNAEDQSTRNMLCDGIVRQGGGGDPADCQTRQNFMMMLNLAGGKPWTKVKSTPSDVPKSRATTEISSIYDEYEECENVLGSDWCAYGRSEKRNVYDNSGSYIRSDCICYKTNLNEKVIYYDSDIYGGKIKLTIWLHARLKLTERTDRGNGCDPNGEFKYDYGDGYCYKTTDMSTIVLTPFVVVQKG